MLFQLYTISFAKTNGIWMPTVIMVVKVKDNQPVKASGKHCWLRHVGYWLLFDLIYLSNGTILQHLQKGKWIDVYQSKYNACFKNSYIHHMFDVWDKTNIDFKKGTWNCSFIQTFAAIYRVVYISCGMVVRHRWHFHGSFHLQKIIVQNQYYTRWYNKGGSRMTLRRTSIRDYFMECVHNHKTLLLHL